MYKVQYETNIAEKVLYLLDYISLGTKMIEEETTELHIGVGIASGPPLKRLSFKI